MIVISPQVIKEENDFVIISSEFQINDKTDVLWYKIPLKYKSYLVSERLDAFVVGLLFLALKTGNNIKVGGAISARLFYTLNHYLINALCLANPKFKRIEISATTLDESDLNRANVAATGLSCGVDSFATYYDHINEEGAYIIKYFTFLNAGSHGDYGGENSRKIFYQRFIKVKEFSDNAGEEIISIDSNISEIIKMNFLQTNTLRNISCVLNLQKLFRNYYLASKNRFDVLKLNAKDNQDYDTLLLNFLSTESTTFYSSVSQLKRTERTELISNFPDTYNHLDVCTNPEEAIKKINCSKCDKCLRTQLTLDILGNLESYNSVFDLKEYYKRKNDFIGKIIARRNDPFSSDIYDLIKERKLNKRIYRYYEIKFKLMFELKGFKKHIKKKLKK